MAETAQQRNSGNHTNERAWERAYDQIKAKILGMEIGPGEVISELRLADELGISRTPIREAIKQLEQEGLIETRNRRKRVYVLRIHEIKEIFDIKKGVEGQIAKAAVERKEPEQEQELRSLVEDMQRFSRSHSFEDLTQDHVAIKEWLELDHQFHTLLYRMARNRRAEQLIESLNHQWHRLRLGLLAMEGRLERSVAEHQAMARAILDSDATQAHELMVNHLERLRTSITNIMQIFHFPM